MKKKIGSTITAGTETVSYEIGTFDKKNPEKIFINGGIYITPTSNENDYTEQISKFRDICNKKVKSIILNSPLASHDAHLLVIEVADGRIKQGKKSYLSFQLHFKVGENILETTDFKDIAIAVQEQCTLHWDDFINQIKLCGFECSKTK